MNYVNNHHDPYAECTGGFRSICPRRKNRHPGFFHGATSARSSHRRAVSDDVQAQTRQVLFNIKAILEAAGCSLDRVLKATVFITNMDDFDKINEVYAGFFSDTPPARSCVEVSGLAKGAKVEIEAIALL